MNLSKTLFYITLLACALVPPATTAAERPETRLEFSGFNGTCGIMKTTISRTVRNELEMADIPLSEDAMVSHVLTVSVSAMEVGDTGACAVSYQTKFIGFGVYKSPFKQKGEFGALDLWHDSAIAVFGTGKPGPLTDVIKDQVQRFIAWYAFALH